MLGVEPERLVELLARLAVAPRLVERLAPPVGLVSLDPSRDALEEAAGRPRRDECVLGSVAGFLRRVARPLGGLARPLQAAAGGVGFRAGVLLSSGVGAGDEAGAADPEVSP